MMNRFFGRNEQIEDMVAGLETRIVEQNRSLVATGTAVLELEKVVGNLRQYMEASEVRVRKHTEAMFEKVKESYEQGFDNAVQLITKEVKALGNSSKPKEVVKAIEKRTEEEKKARRLRAIKAKINEVRAEYLVHDLPLVKDSNGYKNPELTPQGEAVYGAIGEFIVGFSKVIGKNKEFFTNRGQYERFFKVYNIAPYKRITVRKKDGTNMSTLLSAIIVRGHVKQYLDHIIGLLEKEEKDLKEGAE